MKGELELNIMNQIALRKDVKMTTDSFADWLIAIGNKIHDLGKSCAIICSKSKIPEGFYNDLGTLQHNDKQNNGGPL